MAQGLARASPAKCPTQMEFLAPGCGQAQSQLLHLGDEPADGRRFDLSLSSASPPLHTKYKNFEKHISQIIYLPPHFSILIISINLPQMCL